MLKSVVAVTATVAALAWGPAAPILASPVKGCEPQNSYGDSSDTAPQVNITLSAPVVPSISLGCSDTHDYVTDYTSAVPGGGSSSGPSSYSDKDDGSVPQDANRIKLDYGAFTGFTFSPYNDDIKVRVHLGIPYAQPPIGSLRFMPPQPITKDLGEMNATSFGPTCVQNFTATNPFSQSEDCLTINVYAPASIAKGAKLPVMVYVYGGNFDSGSSSNSAFNGSTLVHRSVELGQDVVVVTFNYRLGVFGFLASPEIQAAGGSNAGLKDQVAAFRWVRKNIGLFGGDASKVTAFGQSAGSCSLANHMTATLPASNSAPLFDAAILESSGVHFGFTFNWTTVYGTITAGLSGVTGCKNLTCLQSLPTDTLRSAQLFLRANGASFRPYVDGDYIPVNPQKRLLSGDFQQIPLLIGTNTDEGTYFNTAVTAAQYNALLPSLFPGLPTAYVQTAYTLYPLASYANTAFGAAGASFLAGSDLIGDVAIQCPSQRVADAFSQFSKAVDPADGKPLVFRYRFNHLPAFVPQSQLIGGVAHSYEVPYTFAAPLTDVSANETQLAREIVSAWTFFAQAAGRKGVDGYKGQTVAWPKSEFSTALGVGGGQRLRIDAAGSYAVEVDNVRTAKCNFWNALTLAVSAP